MDSESVLEHILKQDKGIVLLDGYSGCGKTTCIRKLKATSSRSVFLFSYRDVVDTMLRTKCTCDEYLLDICKENCVICIEDVDYLFGKDVTQEHLAKMLQTAAQKHLIILTGNDTQARIPVLCQMCTPNIIEFKQLG